jgi:hypothetical protein
MHTMTFSLSHILRLLGATGLAVMASSCLSRPPYPPDGNVFINERGRPRYGHNGTYVAPDAATNPSQNKPKNTGEDPSKLHDSATNKPADANTTADGSTEKPVTDTPPTDPVEDKPKPTPNANLPYGTPVIGEKGYVYSPYAPDKGKVDVREIPSGTKVECPYTQKVFRVP